MVSNTTIHKQGVKSVSLKTTGHEKCMVSVCLAAKKDGTKLKPFEFESRCVVKSFGNAWMNKELITIWVKRVLAAFSFSWQLLAWDSYKCHRTDRMRKDLKRLL